MNFKCVALGFIVISVTCATSVFGATIKSEQLFTEFKYNFSSTYTSNLRHIENPEYFSVLNLTGSLSTKIKNKIPLSFSFVANKNFQGREEFTLGNTSIRTSGDFVKNVKRSHTLILPTSEMSRKNNYLQSSLINSLVTSKELYKNDHGLVINSSLIASFIFNMHQYKTSILGASNTNYGFSQLANLGISYDKFNLSFVFGANQYYTYLSNLSETLYSSKLYMSIYNWINKPLKHGYRQLVVGY